MFCRHPEAGHPRTPAAHWRLLEALEEALQPEHGAPLLGFRENGGPVVPDYEEPVLGVVGYPPPPSEACCSWPSQYSVLMLPPSFLFTCPCPAWGGGEGQRRYLVNGCSPSTWHVTELRKALLNE